MIRYLVFLAGCCQLVSCSLTPDPTPPHIVSSISSLDTYDTTDFPAESAQTQSWWTAIGGQELDGLVVALMTESLTLQESRLRIDQAAERALQARSARSLSIAGSSDVGLNRSTGVNGSNSWTDSYGLGLSLDYTADVFGGLRSTERAAELSLFATELTYRSTEQQEISLLVRNWVAAATLKRRLELAIATADSFGTTFELTDQQYRAGSRNTSASDVQIARQNLDSSLVNIPDLRTQLETQLLEIDRQLARLPGETKEEFLGEINLDPEPSIPVGIPVDLLSNRPDVAAAELSYLAALEDVGSARADLYPLISFSASLSFQDDTLGGVFDWDDYIASLATSLTQPVFQGGRLRSEVRLQQAEAEELATSFARTALEAIIDVEQAAAEVKGLSEQIELEERALATAVLSDEISQNRYFRGLDSLLAVLETQRSLNNARESLILTQQLFLNAQIDLYQSLGGVWLSPDLESRTDPSSGGP